MYEFSLKEKAILMALTRITNCNDIATAREYARDAIKLNEPERELFSIKELEWTESFDDEVADTPFGTYVLSRRAGLYWRCYLSESDADVVINENCTSIEDGKRQATAHYRERIMQCLNREV